MGRAGIEPRTAGHEQRPLRAELTPERLGHLPGVRQVGVALGDHLADQHGVGVLSLGAGHQVRHADLGAHVHDPDLPVVLKPLLPRVSLHVEDRVDAHGVRVGADARTDHHELAAERRTDPQVHLRRREHGELPLGHGHGRQVDNVADPPVDDEEREVRPHPLGMHDHRRVQPHLGRELQRGAFGPGPLRLVTERHGQRERELHPPVPRGVAVRPDDSGRAHWSASALSSIAAAGL